MHKTAKGAQRTGNEMLAIGAGESPHTSKLGLDHTNQYLLLFPFGDIDRALQDVIYHS